MVFVRVYAFVIVVFLAAACSLNAQILSGSFEGDPNMLLDPNGPWDTNGVPALILETFSPKNHGCINADVNELIPVDGHFFVLLSSGNGSVYAELTQVIDVNAGQTITGAYFFATSDYIDSGRPGYWFDWATITLEDPCSVHPDILLAKKDVNDVASYGSMERWGIFSHDVNEAEAGRYKLVLFISNFGDENLASYLAVDALRVVTGTPEPLCIYQLAGDINRDCRVDFLDFAMMAENWLIDCNVEPPDLACK